ncbi:mucin-5AC isoform X3 [Pleuronectes platessa]|uniref:mucin-5AC isoform X3 n=1 Tax=Pleuronectes platessa TaxID=8262 RepID=UPI00232A63E7|nr:mucin-5AC isoform X3 [Pleuronectes platessa]
MVGLVLFVVLITGSFHMIQIQALLPPKLVVSTLSIRETDTVTLDCQCPPGAFQCYLYTEGGQTKMSSCQKTLSGSELLLMAGQSSPAEVKVKCFFTVKDGDVDRPSPHSEISSITIHSSFHEIQIQALLPPKLVVSKPVITETDTVTLDCQCPTVAFQCYFTVGGPTKRSSCQKTLSGRELLMAGQSSPAEVKVRCFYTVMSGNGHSSSPHSEISSIAIQTPLPPKLVVSTSVITETDTVTLDCQRPPGVFQCYFYTEGGPTQRSSCQKTLSGSELLLLAGQSSPAEVKVRCFFTVKDEDVDRPSPHSEISSITIHKSVEIESHTMQTTQFPMTSGPPASTPVTSIKGLTVSTRNPMGNVISTLRTPGEVKSALTVTTSRNTKEHVSTSSPTPEKPESVEIESHTMQTTQFPMTSGPPASTPVTSIKGLTVSTRNPMGNVISTLRTPGEVTSALTVTTSRNAKEHVSTSSPTPEKPESVEIESHTMQTTQFPMTSGPPASTPVTSIKGLTVSTRNPMGNVISTLRTPGEVTSALTVTTSRNAKEHVSTSSPTPEKPESVEIESHTMQTTQFPMTSGLTVSTRNPMGNVISTLRTPGKVTSALTVTTSRNAKEHVSTSSPTPEKPDMRIWTLKALGVTAAFGVTVGFISLGLTFHCTTRKSGNEKPNKQEPQYEQSVIYHKYDTISEEPSASAPNITVYSTLQPV